MARCRTRLVKEKRLSGIDTIEAGNAFQPSFIDKYNARFAKAPLADRDLHRPLASYEGIDDAFAWKRALGLDEPHSAI